MPKWPDCRGSNCARALRIHCWPPSVSLVDSEWESHWLTTTACNNRKLFSSPYVTPLSVPCVGLWGQCRPWHPHNYLTRRSSALPGLPLLGRAVRLRKISSAVHQSNVRERLRKVAKEPSR